MTDYCATCGRESHDGSKCLPPPPITYCVFVSGSDGEIYSGIEYDVAEYIWRREAASSWKLGKLYPRSHVNLDRAVILMAQGKIIEEYPGGRRRPATTRKEN